MPDKHKELWEHLKRVDGSRRFHGQVPPCSIGPYETLKELMDYVETLYGKKHKNKKGG